MRIIKIGKDNTNDIYESLKDDPAVSRIHCEIFLDDDGNVFLTDKGSTNGTFVNGNKIKEPQILDEFDIVRIGNSVVDWKGFIFNENKKITQEKEPLPIIEKESKVKSQTINNYRSILLFPALILILFLVIYQIFKTPESYANSNQISNDSKIDRKANPKKTDIIKNKELDQNIPINKTYNRPENGFSPYNKYFGKGIYNNSSNNYFLIKNSNKTDAVVLLVDAYSGKKIRNEYIRRGSDFRMTGIPSGTYYLQWVSGNNWSPVLKKGNLVGCFQNDISFTKTRDRDDWMKVSYSQGWTVTLYSVPGGDVESQKISANDFLK